MYCPVSIHCCGSWVLSGCLLGELGGLVLDHSCLGVWEVSTVLYLCPFACDGFSPCM